MPPPAVGGSPQPRGLSPWAPGPRRRWGTLHAVESWLAGKEGNLGDTGTTEAKEREGPEKGTRRAVSENTGYVLWDVHVRTHTHTHTLTHPRTHAHTQGH